MKQKAGEFDLDLEYASHFWQIKKNDIIESIESLKENGLLRVDSEQTPSVLRVDSGPEKNRIEKSREEKNRNYSSAELSETTVHAEFTISQKLFDSWIQTYGDKEWILLELKKARDWCLANPLKKPKTNHTRFLNGWLSRGWDRHRQKLPSNKAKTDIAAILGEVS